MMKKGCVLSLALSVLLLMVGCTNKTATIPTQNENATSEIVDATVAVEADAEAEKAEPQDISVEGKTTDTTQTDTKETDTTPEETRDPADNPARQNEGKEKEVYDNPIIQEDSETYIEYLGKTMSLKEYYEELATVDPESFVHGGDIERLLAYAPDWAEEHGYTVEDIPKEETQADSQTQQQQQQVQQPSNRIEDNSVIPAPDPSLIDNSDDTGEIPDSLKAGHFGHTGGDTTLDWGNADPSWIQVN